MKIYIFRVDLIEEDDGAWSADVPSLPGCASSGDTPQEALSFVRDLAAAYVDVLIEDGESVPVDSVISGEDGAAISVNVLEVASPVGV